MNGIAWCLMAFLATTALSGGPAGTALHGIPQHSTGGIAYHGIWIGAAPHARVRTQAPMHVHGSHSLGMRCPATGC